MFQQYNNIWANNRIWKQAIQVGETGAKWSTFFFKKYLFPDFMTGYILLHLNE